MATNNWIAPATTVVDQNFYIPEGLASFVYVETTDQDPVTEAESTGDDTVQIYTGELVPEAGAVDAVTYILPVPQDFTIVSQIIRLSPDGRQLVDVVFDTSDLEGVTNFEVRVTKV